MGTFLFENFSHLPQTRAIIIIIISITVIKINAKIDAVTYDGDDDEVFKS